MKKQMRRDSRSARKLLRHGWAAAPRKWVPSAAMVAIVLSVSPPAAAYVGPGAGMGILGILLAVLAAFVMAVVGLVLWPLRVLAYRRKLRAGAAGARSEGSTSAPAEGGVREQPAGSREHPAEPTLQSRE